MSPANQLITIFHPDFPFNYPLGGAIIECEGGISFRFPLHLLSISTLFADAAEIHSFANPNTHSGCDTDDDSKQHDTTITLSGISPQGFHLLLSALHPTTPYFTLAKKSARIGSKSLDDILKGYQVADFLDIPTSTFSRLLIPHFADPFVKFALSTAISSRPDSRPDEDLIRETTLGTLGSSFDSMSRMADWLMMELGSSYYCRLRRLHQERQKIPTTLFKAFCSDPTPDGVEAFTKNCLKTSCPASRSVKNKCWSALRLRAASQVWEILLKIGCPIGQRVQVASKILEGSCRGCSRCLERISACITKSILDLEAGLPVTI